VPTDPEELYIVTYGNDTSILKEFIEDAMKYCPSLDKDKISICNLIISRSIASKAVGLEVISIFNFAADSSTKSMALSGRYLSAIYLSDKLLNRRL
jgi:hypothetical protein